MKIVIGIISYLPDDEKIRVHRMKELEALVKECDKLFNLPILIVAQNWRNDFVCSHNLTIKYYDKLGITGARKELRKWFLETDYDYLIMLDDDCIITGSLLEAKKYIKQIELHPNEFGLKRSTLLKLAAFSRYIMEQVDFPNIHPENNGGFEDAIFVKTAEIKFPDKCFVFADGLRDLSNSVHDPFSVWHNEYRESIDLELLKKNTQEYIGALDKDQC